MPKYETLLFEADDGVATLTLNRPEALNPFSVQMQRELAAVIARIADEDAIRAVILTGAGRAFSAGGDINEMETVTEPTPLSRHKGVHRMLTTVLMPLLRLEKPVIAAVNGPAFGAGMNLALAADITLAADTARLYLLSRLIGINRAKELCFTGRTLSAREALDLGLLNRLLPPTDLMPAAKLLALELAHGASVAIGFTTSLLNIAYTASLEEMAELEAYALAVTLSTDDHRDGIRAFREKRLPRFSAR